MNNTANNYIIPHMEGIDATAKAFGLSSYQVRKLARSRRGAAFTVKLGSRYLINQEKFAAFLNCETQEQDTVSPAQSASCNLSSVGIRPVPVKL